MRSTRCEKDIECRCRGADRKELGRRVVSHSELAGDVRSRIVSRRCGRKRIADIVDRRCPVTWAQENVIGSVKVQRPVLRGTHRQSCQVDGAMDHLNLACCVGRYRSLRGHDGDNIGQVNVDAICVGDDKRPGCCGRIDVVRRSDRGLQPNRYVAKACSSVSIDIGNQVVVLSPNARGVGKSDRPSFPDVRCSGKNHFGSGVVARRAAGALRTVRYCLRNIELDAELSATILGNAQDVRRTR